jgi:pyridoxamine 5'-phosphate oxidase
MLPETAPGFDQPIAVLKHCHDRIRKQLATLQNLVPHLADHGADRAAQEAATAVRRYFNQAAPHHHADEEEDLLPMLHTTAVDTDATLLRELTPRILAEHQTMHTAWHALDGQLQAIADGSAAALSAEQVTAFCGAYAGHMEIEETNIAPMAKRIFSPAQMAQLGDAMRSRRGIPATN